MRKFTLIVAVALLALQAGVTPHAFAQTSTTRAATSLTLAGSNGTDPSHNLTLVAPPLSSSFSLTLPNANHAGILLNDGVGGLSWTTLGIGNLPLGGSNQFLVTNSSGLLVQWAGLSINSTDLTGNGIGTPLDIASTYPGGTGITTLGTISAGTWQGSTIDLAHGGTGQTTRAAAFNALVPDSTGSTGKVIEVAPGGGYNWITPSSGSVTAVSVASANGFAGTSSGGATPALTLSTTVTGLLKGNGTAISAATAGTDYTLLSGLTAHGALYATAANAVTSTGAMTNGQLLIGKTGNVPQLGTIGISGSGISVTNGAGTITLANTGVTGLAFTGGTLYGNILSATGAVTLAPSLNTQSANTIFAGPVSGVAAAPTFRTMVTADIPNSTVTYAQMQNEGVTSLLGNPTGSSAAPSEITLGAGLSFSGSTLTATGAVSSVSNSDGTLTISPTTGAVVGSLALGHANTWIATQTLPTTDAEGSALANSINNATTTKINGSEITGAVASATNATNVATTLQTASASTFYPTFVSSNATNSGQAADVATGLSYVPSTGTLSATTFSGSFAGNATGFTGSLVGDVTGTQGATAINTSSAAGGHIISALTTNAGSITNNTTGSAAKLTTARTIAGTSFDGSASISLANKFIVQGTTDAGLSNAQFLGLLATGLVKNTTTTGVLSIAGAGTDYSAGTSALATGILKSTTTTGALTIAVAADFPMLNQNTTGTANIAGGTLGAIPYQSAANTTTVLAATATANQLLLSGASAAPAWSTATYPATTTISQLLYSSAANTVTGLATANNGVLATNSSGVPSITVTPTLGVAGAGGTTGTLTFATSGSGNTGTSTFQAGAQGATNFNYTLPITAPGANQVLTVTGYAAPAVTLGWTTPLANPMTTLGDLIYENGTPAPARLAGSTTASTKEFLTSTATAGSVAQAPAWATLAAGDIPSGSANYIQNTSSQQATSNFNISGSGTIGGTLTVPTETGGDGTTGTALTVRGGNGSTGAGAALALTGGTSAGTNNGAGVSITGTNGSATGTGGAISITGGNSTGSNQNAGGVTINAGNSTGTGTSTINFNVAPVGTTSSTSNNNQTVASLASPSTTSTVLTVGKTSSTTGSLSLANSGNANLTTLQAGASAPAMTYILPTTAPGLAGQVLSANGTTTPVQLSWAAGGVQYGPASTQNALTPATKLFDVAYAAASGASATDVGAAITANASGATNGTAYGLTIAATGSGTGTATGLSVSATGGTTANAIAVTSGNVNISSLSASDVVMTDANKNLISAGSATTVGQNKVLAGPSTGGSGAASFRTLTGADLAAASNSTGSVAVLGRSTADITTHSSTLINATGYSLVMAANEVWAFEFDLNVNGGGNGIDFAVTAPSGATVNASVMGIFSANSAFKCDRLSASGQSTDVGKPYGKTNSDGPVRITGVVANGSTPGNIQLQWDSNDGSTVVTVYAGSYGIAHRF